ncbi:hypothetical protein Tco_0237459 [Tanacetum coccineum]
MTAHQQPQDDTSANVVRDTSSPTNAETGDDTEKSNNESDSKILNVDKERGEDVSNTMALEERIVELDEGQAGSDPSKTPESRPLPERAGPNPEPMHEDFVAIVCPQVHESLKLATEEHVHIENPPSSFGTLSSMKNLDDAFTFGDQFLNDKLTEEEPGKANVETKVKSMVIVSIHQASSPAPPLSTPIIDLTPPKPASPPTQEPIFTTTTTTTTTLLPLPPPPQQSTIDLALATRVSALEKICANFEKKHKIQDKTTQSLSSRVFTLENHDLYSKIDNYINKTVEEAIHNALQAPIRERFRELSEFEIKEILHDRMFESGSYRSHPEHTALYDALELSMDRENMEEFIEATSKYRKRRRDEQDPHPPPPKDSKQSKKKMHDSEALASKQPPLVDDVPIPDDVHFSDSKDTGATHILKIKTRPDWLKPLPKEKAPKTPEPDWVIPPNDLPEIENNWADALAKAYKDPEENKLLQKTRDMGSFINWYCKQIRKSKLVKLVWKVQLTNQIDLLNSKGDKERRIAMSLSKLKVAYFPVLRAQRKLVPSLWIRKNNQKTMIRETKVHKFSNGTLMRILEKLDVIVKDYVLFKFNPGMEHRIWSEDDKRGVNSYKVIERRSFKANFQES